MLTKLLGIATIALGLFILIGAPGDRVQIPAYTKTGRLMGLGVTIFGIVLLLV